MKTLKTDGHCISCSRIIHYNINKVQCAYCSKVSKNGWNNWITGKFCHFCGLQRNQISNHDPHCADCSFFDRTDNSIDEHYTFWIQQYNSLTSKEKKEILPLWDCEYEKVKFGLDIYVLKKYKTGDMIELLRETTTLNTSRILENEPKSNRRIMNAIRSWQQQTLLLPPTITDEEGKHFNDGRHRTLATYFLESEFIMVYEKLK